MDAKQDTFWDDRAKLYKGEWSSKGEKWLVLDVSEILIKHQVRGDKLSGNKKPFSHLTYELTCPGKQTYYVIIGKLDDWPDIQSGDEHYGIGWVEFYEESGNSDDIVRIIIGLHPTSYEELTKLFVPFQGKLRIEMSLKKMQREGKSDDIYITGYTLSNQHELRI